jgi:hypothetical protein
MKIILALFLSCLCLVGVLHEAAPISLHHCSGHGNSTPVQSGCAHDDYARCSSQRVFAGSVQHICMSRETITKEVPAFPHRVVSSKSPLGEAFLLAQRWQFFWRAAAPPRAPSSLV